MTAMASDCRLCRNLNSRLISLSPLSRIMDMEKGKHLECTDQSSSTSYAASFAPCGGKHRCKAPNQGSTHKRRFAVTPLSILTGRARVLHGKPEAARGKHRSVSGVIPVFLAAIYQIMPLRIACKGRQETLEVRLV